MWYVDLVGTSSKGSMALESVKEFVPLCDGFKQCEALYIRLRNSDTNEYILARGGNRNWVKFDALMDRYRPYGMVWVSSDYRYCSPRVGGFIKDYKDFWAFVEVDKLSLKFLDYVECVESVENPSDSELNLFGKLSPVRRFWDDDKTFMKFDSVQISSKCVTLFEAICFYQSAWSGSCYYLVDVNNVLYRVKFTDVGKVRAFVSKAKSFGYRISNHLTYEDYHLDWSHHAAR